MVDVDERVQAPTVVDHARRAGEADRVRVHEVAGRAADAQDDVARLDDALAGARRERREVGGDREPHIGGGAGLEGDPGEADQPLHGTDDRRDRVVQVELHDHGAGARAGVAEPEPHAGRAVRRDLVLVAAERRPVERRVPETVTERVMVNRGSPENPLDATELTAKFTANASGAGSEQAVKHLADEVWNVAGAQDTTGLTRALSAVVTGT